RAIARRARARPRSTLRRDMRSAIHRQESDSWLRGLAPRRKKHWLGMIWLQDLFQFGAQLHSGAVQAAAHRADRQIEDGADRLVVAAVQLSQHYDRPMLLGELRQGGLHLPGEFLAFEAVFGRRFAAGRLMAPIFALLLDRYGRLVASLAADRNIERDAI